MSIRGSSKYVSLEDAKKLIGVVEELLPWHHLVLHLSSEGTDGGKTPYLVAHRVPLSLEELKRFEGEEPKIYNFHHRQLRLSPDELKALLEELQKIPEILP